MFIDKPDQIPVKSHWAIIRSTSVFIPGDERSRTAPGHGYPERTETYITYEVFFDRDEFDRAMQKCGKDVRGIYVTQTYAINTVVEVVDEIL